MTGDAQNQLPQNGSPGPDADPSAAPAGRVRPSPPAPRPPSRTGVERLLGAAAATGDPRAVLGLSHSGSPGVPALSTAVIDEAVRARLETINQSPESGTPSGEDARLAVHVAAAQLRLELARPAATLSSVPRPAADGTSAVPGPRAPIARSAPSSPAMHAQTAAPTAASSNESNVAARRQDTLPPEARRAMIAALAATRGRPARRRRRLAQVAQIHGISAATLLNTPGLGLARPVRHASAAGGNSSATARNAPTSRGSTPPRPDPTQATDGEHAEDRGDRAGLLWITILLGAGALTALVFVVLPRFDIPEPGSDPRQVVQGEEVTSVPPEPPNTADALAASPNASATRSVRDLGQPAALLEELTAAVEGHGFNPGSAAERMRRGLAALAARWHTLSPDELAAANGAVIDFAYRLGPNAALAAEFIDRIASPPPPPASLASHPLLADLWSAGLVARLSRESGLPASAGNRLEAARDAAFGTDSPADPGFLGGLEAALGLTASSLADETEPQAANEAAAAWLDAAAAADRYARADASAADRPFDRDRLIMAAVLDLLARGPSLDGSPSARTVTRTLVASLDWADRERVRRWGLSLLNSPELDAADLAALTEAIARSNAPGIDDSLIVSPSDSMTDVRRKVRRIAEAWNLERAAPTSDAIASLRRAFERIERLATAGAAQDRLARLTAAQATLAAAAAHLHSGDAAAASTLVTQAEQLAERPRAPQRARTRTLLGRPPDRPGDRTSRWALEYLRAGSHIERRTDLLYEFQHAPGPVDPVAAEIVADAAVRGSQIRKRAGDALRPHADDPAVINAMLEVLPDMPVTRTRAELVQHIAARPLPDHDADSWPAEARRALLARLMDRLEGDDADALIDDAQDDIAAAYAEAAAADPLAPPASRSPGAAPLTPVEAARELLAARRNLPGRAGGVTPGRLAASEITARRAARVGSARGPIQAFAAEQLAVVEYLAAAIAAERPAETDRIEDLLGDLARQRRAATSGLAQIIAAEQARVRLWLLRLDETPETAIYPRRSLPAAVTTAILAAAPSNGDSADEKSTPDAREADRRTNPRDALPEGFADLASRLPSLGARLAQLEPTDPAGYFRLAEEVAAAGFTRAHADLAQTLAVLAFALAPNAQESDQRELRASAAILLAEMQLTEGDARWLRGLAARLDSDYAAPDLAAALGERVDPRLALEAAETLGYVRAGRGFHARRRLADDDIRGLLRHHSDAVAKGSAGSLANLDATARVWPCPQCRNDRSVNDRVDDETASDRRFVTRICPTCLGNPGPILSQAELLASLAIEASILSVEPNAWSNQLALSGDAPLRDPDPRELAPVFGVDPSAAFFRAGSWTDDPDTRPDS